MQKTPAKDHVSHARAIEPCKDPIFPPPDLSQEVRTRLSTWQHFVGLAIHIDSQKDKEKNSQLHATLTRCLENLATEHAGIWFEWQDSLYGCVLPQNDSSSGETAAQGIQTELAQNLVETVSIGIAHYPLMAYNPVATMQNCCKALDHAAFFGPNQITVFDAISLNISGDYFYQAGQLEAAMEEYRAALHLDADNVNVINSLGVCLAQMNDHDQARTTFETAHRIDPKEAMAQYNLGVLALLDEAPDTALEHFKLAYGADPETVEIPFQIGKILAEQKNYQEAITYLASAMNLRVDYAPTHTLLGKSLAGLGRTQEAIAAYKKAVKLNPNDAVALSALGTLYDAKGENPDICLTFCQQSVVLAPDNGRFRLRLARLYHKYNRLDLALTEYERANALGCDAQSQIAEINKKLASIEETKQCCAG